MNVPFHNRNAKPRQHCFPISLRKTAGLLLISGALLAVAPQHAFAQNKMRKLNNREKEALTDFQKKKDNKDKDNKADTKKKGKGGILVFLHLKKKPGGPDAGLDHATKIQEKEVRKRMRKHRRQAKHW